MFASSDSRRNEAPLSGTHSDAGGETSNRRSTVWRGARRAKWNHKQARQRVADDDALLAGERRELPFEHGQPLIELRRVGLRKCRVAHLVAALHELRREQELPVLGRTVVFDSVENEEARRHAHHAEWRAFRRCRRAPVVMALGERALVRSLVADESVAVLRLIVILAAGTHVGRLASTGRSPRMIPRGVSHRPDRRRDSGAVVAESLGE